MTQPLFVEDSRIAQARAAIDDARTHIADLLEEIPVSEWPVRHYLVEARARLNNALTSLGKLA